jgi:acyl-CoA synthetase (AMP-forming)/AMP-acid ligase II
MPFRSPHPDVEIPDVSLTEHVLARASELGDKPALVDGASGRELTYAGLAGAVRRFGAALAARGMRKGDVLAIFSPNVPEYAVVFHGVCSIGGVNTTLNPLYTAEEIAFQLRDSGARWLFTVEPLLERALAAVRDTGVEEVFVLGEGDGATSLASVLAEEHGDPPSVATDPDEDLAVLPYSSGTTGLPKGVMLTHRNVVANLCQIGAVQEVGEDDKLVGVLPFFHIYGMQVIMNLALRKGATVVTMPRFDLAQFLALVEDRQITRAYLVPPIVLALAKHPLVDEHDLSSLGLIMSGAAPLGPELADACSRRLDCLVVQGYGLTETSPVTHTTPERRDRNRPGAVGLPAPNTEVRVVDPESGRDLGAGETGEVWVRGPQVMRGYLGNDDATRATIDDEGWLHTGDLGYVDSDGYLFVVDRLKELIKYKGFQVAPAELEEILLSHPGVADAAVIPSPDEEAGEVPKAFVVLAGDGVATDEVVDYVAERVAPQKRVRRIEVVEEIPKSPSGKILRRVLVDRERAARAS